MSDLLKIQANRLQKTSDSLKKLVFWYVFDSFPLFMPKSELLMLLFTHLLFSKELLDQFAPVFHCKRVTLAIREILTMEKGDRVSLR